MLPLVGEHEIDVAEDERGERLLRLGLDELAAQLLMLLHESPEGGDGDVERRGLEGRDPRSSGDPARSRR